MSFVKTLMRATPFPEPVAKYVVDRFDVYLKLLLENPNMPDSAFVDVDAAATSANIAEALLARPIPGVVTKWCASRDKREGTVQRVMSYWMLPVEEQCKLASKALSEDAASSVLRADCFADAAKAVVTKRAKPDQIATWLASDPSDLSDESFIEVLDRLESARRIIDNVQLYSGLYARRHLLDAIVSGANDQVAMAACAFVDDIDHAAALDRIERTASEYQASGLINLLDHPSLDPNVRQRGFDLAERLGVLDKVYAAGCLLPGSLLTAPTPLSAIDDARLLEALATRVVTEPVGRIFQFADLATAPAASAHLVHRLANIRRKFPCVGTARSFGALETKAGLDLCSADTLAFWSQVRNAQKQHANQRAEQAKAAALTEPARTDYRSGYRTSYWGSNGEAHSAEKLLDMAPDDVTNAVYSYRSHESNPKALGEALVSILGDGTSEKSLKHWERFIQLAQRATAGLTLRKMATSAVKLG